MRIERTEAGLVTKLDHCKPGDVISYNGEDHTEVFAEVVGRAEKGTNSIEVFPYGAGLGTTLLHVSHNVLYYPSAVLHPGYPCGSRRLEGEQMPS